MMFQNYALYPQMRVGKNMSFLSNSPASLRMRLPKRSTRLLTSSASSRRSNAIRASCEADNGNGSLWKRDLRDPAVFLFDVPLSNLDAKLPVQMRAETKALQQWFASTMLHVTHDQIESMTMADKIVVKHDGVVAQIGSPLELCDRPELVCRGLIVSPAMNFVKARFEGGRRPTLVTASGFEIPLRAAPRAAPDSGLIMGVRPVHVSPGGLQAMPLRSWSSSPRVAKRSSSRSSRDRRSFVCSASVWNGRQGSVSG